MVEIAYSSNVSLSDIAFDCDYSSQANFSKAFKKYFGVTPGQVMKEENLKSNLGKIERKYGKEFKIESLYPSKEINGDLYIKELKMNHVIKEFLKLGLQCYFSMERFSLQKCSYFKYTKSY